MSPDPREIAAVLEAPEAVREVLRRIDGLGVAVRPDGRTYLCAATFMAGRPWLPLSETAILAEATRLAGTPGAWTLESLHRDGVEHGATATVGGLTASGATPRLAAIAVLRAVLDRP